MSYFWQPQAYGGFQQGDGQYPPSQPGFNVIVAAADENTGANNGGNQGGDQAGQQGNTASDQTGEQGNTGGAQETVAAGGNVGGEGNQDGSGGSQDSSNDRLPGHYIAEWQRWW